MSSADNVALLAVELAKLGLQTYFRAAAMANMTDEQLEAFYQETKMAFEKNRPELLVDIT